jgi:hypothetical protein
MESDTLNLIAAVLGWCMVVNYGTLFLWMIFIMFAKLWTYTVHNRWFNITEEEFYATHYRLMGQFKLNIMLFNLAPYLALRIVT